MLTLLAQRRDIASQAAKGGGSRWGTEASRDLLPHFDHPQVALRQVVVEGDREVGHERQHAVPLPVQAVEQILRGALLGAPPLPRGGRRRIGRQARLDQRGIPPLEGGSASGRETAL